VTLVVTGASGFVGRHVVARARERGLNVLGLVRRAEAASVLPEGTRTAVIAGLEPAALAPHFEGAASVLHLAGIGAERDGARYSPVNAGGTRSVVEAARATGVKRIVYLSGLGVAAFGRSRRVTNRYFLSKLEAETALFGWGPGPVVRRPSWILGPGGDLMGARVRELEAGRAEIVGDGAYRLQPIAVSDAADAVLAAATRGSDWPLVFDLVGAEPIRYRDFVARVASHVEAPGYAVRRLGVEDAERLAAGPGYRGMGPEALDCLLCNEVAPAAPLEALLGRPLLPLDAVIGAALERP